MKDISLAMIAVMNDVNWVAKNMQVWEWKNSYKWVSDKDVKEAIRESMIKNWLSILPIWVSPKIQIDRWQEDDTYQKQPPYPKKTKQSVFTEVETRYLLIHTSWESIELAWYGQWVDTQDKGAWKATTYALKNTLLNMFLIPTWVDTDNTHSDEYDIPKKKTADSFPWKPKELIEFIEEIREEKDVNHIKTLVNQAWSIYKTEKQLNWIKEEARKRTDTLNDLSTPKF